MDFPWTTDNETDRKREKYMRNNVTYVQVNSHQRTLIGSRLPLKVSTSLFSYKPENYIN